MTKLYAVVDPNGKPVTLSYNKSNPWYSRKGHADRAAEYENKRWAHRPDAITYRVEEFTLVPVAEYESLKLELSARHAS